MLPCYIPYTYIPSVSQCKFHGGPLCLRLVTYNRKPEETITMQIFAYFDSLFLINALMIFKI